MSALRKPLDRIDRRILALLQQDATLPVAEIAHRVGLSQSPCWKRIQRLQAEGVILGRVALVEPEAVGLGLTAFVSVETNEHSVAQLDSFASAVSAMPEVVELHRMTGDVDYLLKVLVADNEAYRHFYRRLIAVGPIKKVTTRLSMERLKATTVLPIDET